MVTHNLMMDVPVNARLSSIGIAKIFHRSVLQFVETELKLIENTAMMAIQF